MHQTLAVADGFVAGLHRSSFHPDLSSEHYAGKGEVSSREACGLGAGDAEGTLCRCRQPLHAPRPAHAYVLLPGR